METNAKHTAGPWEAHTFMVKGGEKMRDTICHVGVSTSLGPSRSNESVANARLIAAAPDLLKALEALRLQALQSSVNDRSNEWGMEALGLANAAIAKAHGATVGA